MLDLRYHALSLVAVFLALAIGIVLGVTIGDSLLSATERGLRDNLRSEVVDARRAADDARREAGIREELIERLLPGVVRDRLAGRRVAIVGWRDLPEGVEDSARTAVEEAGGRVDSVSEFADPVEDLEQAIGPDDFAALAAEERALQSFGRRLGTALLSGRGLPSGLRRLEGDRYRGRYGGADAVVYYHAPDDAEPRTEAGRRRGAQAEVLEDGLLEAFADYTGPIVGVELADTDPSQVGWYRSHDLTSVDSVDLASGRLALVFALAGAEGTFGLKPSAREPVPDPGELG